jgi:hypothetical protein
METDLLLSEIQRLALEGTVNHLALMLNTFTP